MFSGERNVKYKELKKREETMDGTSVEIVNPPPLPFRGEPSIL